MNATRLSHLDTHPDAATGPEIAVAAGMLLGALAAAGTLLGLLAWRTLA
jgi:hypothetical protein